MLKCVMLDVDGVLISGRPEDGENWTHTLLSDTGIDPDALVADFFYGEWGHVVTGKTDLLPALSRSLHRIGARVTAEELVAYWFAKDSRIVPSVLSDCRRLRQNQIRIYLATNQDHMRARYLMDDLNLRAEVDGIVWSAQVGVQKPHPGFYAYAAACVQCDPGEIILVDDGLANVEAAIEAGWNAVHWTGRQTLWDVCAVLPNT